MLIDLSHCGPKVVADVLKLSEKPVTIGHTCCKSLADNPRNKTDEQMKMLKENGGVIDHNGLYQAPEIPGTYEITAASGADPSVTASAFVIVE